MRNDNETRLEREVEAVKHDVDVMASELAQLANELQGIKARDWGTHGDLARLREELRSTINVAAEIVAIERRRDIDGLIKVVVGK